MRITVTTDEGEVVQIFTDNAIGDLSKPLARADAIEQIREAVEQAREIES